MSIGEQKIELEDEEEEYENFYTREQLILFLYCFEQENNLKRFSLFHLLAFSGMRKGEAFALKWKDIDFKTQEIRITKAVARTIKIDVKTIDLLKQWKIEQMEIYKELGFNTNSKQQLVFSNTKNVLNDPNKTVQ